MLKLIFVALYKIRSEHSFELAKSSVGIKGRTWFPDGTPRKCQGDATIDTDLIEGLRDGTIVRLVRL
jgi:hypothetical protein